MTRFALAFLCCLPPKVEHDITYIASQEELNLKTNRYCFWNLGQNHRHAKHHHFRSIAPFLFIGREYCCLFCYCDLTCKFSSRLRTKKFVHGGVDQRTEASACFMSLLSTCFSFTSSTLMVWCMPYRYSSFFLSIQTEHEAFWRHFNPCISLKDGELYTSSWSLVYCVRRNLIPTADRTRRLALTAGFSYLYA